MTVKEFASTGRSTGSNRDNDEFLHQCRFFRRQRTCKSSVVDFRMESSCEPILSPESLLHSPYQVTSVPLSPHPFRFVFFFATSSTSSSPPDVPGWISQGTNHSPAPRRKDSHLQFFVLRQAPQRSEGSFLNRFPVSTSAETFNGKDPKARHGWGGYCLANWQCCYGSRKRPDLRGTFVLAQLHCMPICAVFYGRPPFFRDGCCDRRRPSSPTSGRSLRLVRSQ